MEKKDFAYRLRNFRKMARNYYADEGRLQQLRAASGVKDADSLRDEYLLLASHSGAVEEVMHRTGRKFGREAEEMLWKCYVDGYTQAEVSRLYHVSLRTLQRWFHVWLKEGLYEEK